MNGPAPIFNTESELKCKYALVKGHYTPKSREYIEGKFAVLQKSSDSKEKHHAKECLKYFLTINSGVQKGFSFSADSLRKEISASLYGMETVTERIVEILMAARRSGNSNCRILLVGSPGTGKTEMVHGVSRGINRPIVTIEGSAMRSGLDLIGEDKIYDKSEPGAATLHSSGRELLMWSCLLMKSIKWEKMRGMETVSMPCCLFWKDMTPISKDVSICLPHWYSLQPTHCTEFRMLW